jgi:hypothetical protein
LFQLFDERDDVNRPRGFGQIHHSRINATVRVKRKLLWLKVLGGLIEGFIVEENRAEDRPFGFDVRR